MEVGRTILPLATEGGMERSKQPLFLQEIPPYRRKDPAVQPEGYVPPGEKILYEEYLLKVMGDFRSLYKETLGTPVPSYPRCRAAISQRASTFEALLNLRRELLERGPDGQGGRGNPVFLDLLQVVQQTRPSRSNQV